LYLLLLIAARLTPAQRSMRASIAASTRWANEDPAEQGQRMRRGFLERFEREVDPEGQLPPAERERRARSALRAHMQRLAFRSSKARSRQAGDGDAAT
jgi:hypothetical protein